MKINFNQNFFSDVLFLSDSETAAILRLTHWSASRIVGGFYSNQSDGSFSDREGQRISLLTAAKWVKVKKSLNDYLLEEGGKFFIRKIDSWVDFGEAKDRRPTLSAAVRVRVGERDNWTCGYCGSKDGPFDIDHEIPVISGGSSDDDNLLCACARCNRSKGAKPVAEWVS